MYKLENNVEWTENLKNAFKHGITKAKIIYTDNEESHEINQDNNLVSIEIKDHKYVPNVGFIGQATSRMATIKLLNTDELLNLENKEIEIKIGATYNNQDYYIDYGTFIVDPIPENDITNDQSEIVAYDYMIKANQYWENNVIYPCTLRQLAEAICSQIGIDLQTESFANEDFIVVNNQFEGETCRTVIQNIAKCAFSWARIGQDNKLYFDFEVNNTPTETITNEEYKVDSFKRANEYYGEINKVTYAQRDIQGQEEFVKDDESIEQNGLNELLIYDNLFAYTTEKRYELIQAGIRLFGLKYMPISQLDMVGLIYLDCNDILELVDMDNETTYLSRNFNHTIKYQGYVSDSIVSEAISQNELQYENKNSVGNAIAKTEIIVDKQNQTIQSVVENVTTQDNKISQISQTVDELNSKISDIADVTVSEETDEAYLEFENINESEPIRIVVHPIANNISLLYPRNNLYPSNSLYMPTRILRFTNISEYIQTTDTKYTNYKKYYSYDDQEQEYVLLVAGTDYTIGNTITGTIYENNHIDYEIPTDLLYYDSENYDEFILDYEGQSTQQNRKVFVNKKVGRNADGTTYVLTTPTTLEFEYPTIDLTNGDYEISLLGYSTAYLFVRLMANNIYTTQFTTHAEVRSEINQTATEINLEVATKVGKNEVISSINQTSEAITINANKVNLTGYVTLTNLSTSGQTTINGSNITTGTIDASRVNVTNLNASNIVSGTLKSSNYVSGTAGTSINLSTGAIDSVNFKVNSTGTVTATNANISGTITSTSGTIGGFTIGSTKLYNGKSSLTSSSSGVYIGTDGISLGTGSTFKVTNAGALTAISGKIGGWSISSDALYKGNNDHYFGTGITATIGGTSRSNIILKAGANFGVNNQGYLYANSAVLTNLDASGKITATDGKIGGWNIGTTDISASSGNMTAIISNLSSANHDFLVVRTGTSGNYQYPFYVRGDGSLVATNATITGTFTANTQSNIPASSIKSGTIPSDRLTGVSANFGTLGASAVNAMTVGADYIEANREFECQGSSGITDSSVWIEVGTGSGTAWKQFVFKGGILVAIN